MSNGLGDQIAAVTSFLGLDKVADAVAKLIGAEGCGCKERQEYLNHLFPSDEYSRTFKVIKNFNHDNIYYSVGAVVDIRKNHPLFGLVITYVKDGFFQEI